MIKSFLKYYAPYKWLMGILMLGSIIRAGMELFFPYVVRQMLDLELPTKDLSQLLSWALGLLCLYIGQLGLQYIVSYLGFKMSAGMENDMRRDLFHHLQEALHNAFQHHMPLADGVLLQLLVCHSCSKVQIQQQRWHIRYHQPVCQDL